MEHKLVAGVEDILLSKGQEVSIGLIAPVITVVHEMEKIRQKWASYGLELPKLVYWNVNARNNTILDKGPNVSFVSGCSPIIFEQVLTGKTGIELMMHVLMSERYKWILV